MRDDGPDPLHREGIDRETTHASQVFLRKIAERYAPVRGLLFGSRARGDNIAQSDADLAIVFRGPPGDRWSIAGELARVAFDVLMEADILVDPLPVWEIELEHPERFPNPSLLRAILRDGRPVFAELALANAEAVVSAFGQVVSTRRSPS